MTRGRFFVISAPSGAGKTSLVKALIEENDRIGVAVSHTTRLQRSGETDGVNYHFVTSQIFQEMISAGDFLEWANVFGNLYGTSSAAVSKVLEGGQHLMLEIDWQGARQVKSLLAETCAIFIMPPSRATLEQRLQSRGQDDDTVIAGRMAEAVEEMSHYGDGDYLVVNDNFDMALEQLEAIIVSQRLRTSRQKQALQSLLQDLLAR